MTSVNVITHHVISFFDLGRCFVFFVKVLFLMLPITVRSNDLLLLQDCTSLEVPLSLVFSFVLPLSTAYILSLSVTW